MMNISKNISKQCTFDYMICEKNSMYENEIRKLGGKVFYYTNKKNNLFKNMKEIYDIIKSNRKENDIFYYNTSGTYYLYPYIIAKFFGYKVVTHAHNTMQPGLNIIFKFLNLINRKIINKTADIKLSCSDLAAEWVYGKKVKDVIIIENGIDIKKYKYNIAIRNKLRKQFGVKDKDIIIGNVGRLEESKNQKFLIKVFQSVLQEKREMKLWIVGNGSLKEELQKEVKENKISNVTFMGNRNDVNELLQAMDLFVFPSKYEGFPITLVEAQTAGLKCLVSDSITKTVKITHLVEFLSINSGINIWKDKILENINYERKDMTTTVENMGFSQRSSAKKIEKILFSISRRIVEWKYLNY